MAKKKIKDELLDHDYDGIQELDNDLPPWWVWMFNLSIIFAVLYLLYYHVFDIGNLQVAEYQAEMKAASQKYAKTETVTGDQQTAATQPLTAYTDADNLGKGDALFHQHCFPCHGSKGEGSVGPNLTDEYWIHGGGMTNVVHTITVGVPAKGMISWKAVLNPEQIKQVASYVLSLQGTNPPNGKAPEGEKYTPAD